MKYAPSARRHRPPSPLGLPRHYGLHFSVLHDSQATPIATVASWSKQAERKRRARLGLRGFRETGSGRRRVSAVTSKRCDAVLQGLP